LAVEEYFYLLWPAIVFIMNRRVLILCAVLFVGSPILRGIFAEKGVNSNLIYELTWF
jgi:peptidoglycan/LPS O-acetylase OafA/YrhL